MTKELFISSSPHETKAALLEDDQVVEVYYQRDIDVGLVGGIYKGRVSRVLPGMQSAFVNIGLERDAFLYVSDFLEDAEEYERVFTETETRVMRESEEAERVPALGGGTLVPVSGHGQEGRATEAWKGGQQELTLATRAAENAAAEVPGCLLYTSPSPRD